MNRTITTLLLAVMLPPVSAWANDEHAHGGPMQDLSPAKSRASHKTIWTSCAAVAGWGLALPAELSGQPGAAHLLELRDELGLSDAQVTAITVIPPAVE